jgi:hypothetical protein
MRVFSKNPAYDDSADLNPNSTAVFHINPNRHDQVHFEPKIHITNPIVQMIEGRELNVQATAYDKNDNMLENLGYFSPGWLPDQGSMFVMDDKGVYPVHYSTGVTPSSVLYGHYNSTGADPAAGTVTVKLFGEYDFVHFGKHGRAATVSVTMISEGYLDIIDLGMFDFPCAYQELDIDKLDRDGVYELSFWVKGYKVTDHANDDSAQIRAGLAFITDDGVSKVAGTALFDLFRGAVAGFKNGHRYETRGDWVRLKTTFTLNGTGKSQNGNDGINNIDSVEKILLYVGTPGTAGGGAPPSYVLYDFINVTRIR